MSVCLCLCALCLCAKKRKRQPQTAFWNNDKTEVYLTEEVLSWGNRTEVWNNNSGHFNKSQKKKQKKHRKSFSKALLDFVIEVFYRLIFCVWLCVCVCLFQWYMWIWGFDIINKNLLDGTFFLFLLSSTLWGPSFLNLQVVLTAAPPRVSLHYATNGQLCSHFTLCVSSDSALWTCCHQSPHFSRHES